jgi:hypothetical protein
VRLAVSASVVAMKTILLLAALALVGCGSKKSGSASACASAINKGVDTMMAAGAQRMAAMGGSMPAEMKAKMDGAAVKLKQVITNRCTEDKWSAEIVDCYGKATTRDDLKACRAKLPAEQSAKLQAEEMQVMSSMMGGMGGMRMHPGGGPGGPGMGGPGMGGPGMGGAMGGAGAPPPSGSATTPPPAGSDTGSAK